MVRSSQVYARQLTNNVGTNGLGSSGRFRACSDESHIAGFRMFPRSVDESLKWFVGFIVVYEEPMYRLAEFPYFLQHLTNVEEKIWSVVELLRRNLHWKFPMISSIYGFNLEWRILDKV
jgi:hypothetical protein